jgi:hypothetical protein
MREIAAEDTRRAHVEVGSHAVPLLEHCVDCVFGHQREFN